MEKQIQDAFEVAKSKLDALVEQRKEIDGEISKWRGVVESLSAVSGELTDELPPDINLADSLASSMTLKFTDGIRMVLQLFNRPLTAPEIRDGLVGLGFDLSKYKQELVPVHNTLKRLGDRKEVEVTKEGNQNRYKWVSPLARVVADLVGPNVAAERAFGKNIRTPLETAIHLHSTLKGKRK